MRSAKAVKRTKRPHFNLNHVRSKKKGILAAYNALQNWRTSTVNSDPLQKKVTAQTAAVFKPKAPKANKEKKEKKPTVAKPKAEVEPEIVSKKVKQSTAEKKAQAAEKKAQEAAQKEQARLAKEEQEKARLAEQARQKEAEKQKQREAEEAKRIEKQRRREEEEAKQLAAKERKEQEAAAKEAEEATNKQKAAEEDAKKKAEAAKAEQAAAEAKKQAEAEKAAAEEAERKKREAEEKAAADLKKQQEADEKAAAAKEEQAKQKASKKQQKKNKKKSGASVSEDEVAQKTINYEEVCKESSSNSHGKELTQQLELDVNESTVHLDAPHTKCSVDSGVDMNDFQAGKFTGKKGKESHSGASLSSTKSSSNESISEFPENDSQPKTPTSTPIEQPLLEKMNGTEPQPTKFSQQVVNFVQQAQQVMHMKAESQPLKHIKIEPIVPLVLPPKIERPKPRERVYKLLPRDIEYCSGMMETYNEDYEAMVKDPRNIYMDTASSIRRKIRIFRDSPQYELYLKAKEQGLPIDSVC